MNALPSYEVLVEHLTSGDEQEEKEAREYIATVRASAFATSERIQVCNAVVENYPEYFI